MHQHTIPVYRTARYALLGDPAGPIEEVWVACHGYGQLASYFLRHFRAVEAPHRLIVAPEGLSRFYVDTASGTHQRVGASWMTREERDTEIDEYVRLLDSVYADVLIRAGQVRARLTAFGFSQGGATVTRWLAHSPMLGRPPADRLVLWGTGLPHDLDLAAHSDWLSTMPLTLVIGDEDEYVTAECMAREEERLLGANIPFDTVHFAGGHRLDADVLQRLASNP